LLGMDTPMPDNPAHGKGCDVDSPVHKILLGNDIVLTEYLCNLNALTKNEIELIVAPLKIQAGDGSPARVIAIEN
jgi:arylformamidase